MAEPCKVRREPFRGICELCETEDDLRPYGLHNENICFSCAMRTVPDQRIRELLKGGQS